MRIIMVGIQIEISTGKTLGEAKVTLTIVFQNQNNQINELTGRGFANGTLHIWKAGIDHSFKTVF